MDRELTSIRAQLADFDRHVSGFRYPKVFRKQVARWARGKLDGGVSNAEISRQLDLRWATIRRWLHRYEASP